MNQNPNVSHHPASVDLYIRHGWKLVPIPPGTKGPMHKDWNKEEKALNSHNELPQGWGIGLAHAYSGTMALDVDHWSEAEKELAKHGINLQELYDDYNAVTIDSGRQGHGKLLYRMPFGLVLPSKKLIKTDEQGNRFNYLDFRCATASGLTVQDVLPPSIHPDTKQPYKWSGRGNWQTMPEIPIPLLTLWQSLTEEDNHRHLQTEGSFNASWTEIEQALEHIDPSISRNEWVHIGMALHFTGMQTNEVEKAFDLWNTWSSQSAEKYQGTKDLISAWRSFKPDHGIRTGTLFHYAKEAGWERPVPSAAELFGPINQEKKSLLTPMDLINGLKMPAPEINLDYWPKALTTRAKEIAEQMGCDPIIPLFAGLAAVCGVADSRIRLQLMDGYKVPPVLWLMTIGAPADKKTPGSKPMIDIIRQLEAEDRPKYKQEFLQWEGLEAMHNAHKKDYLQWSSSLEMQMENEIPPAVPDLPNPPVPLKLAVSDTTSQALVAKAADRPHGLLCYLDEMNNWIKNVNDKRSGENRSSWVEGYESTRYEMERIGRGSIYCENFAVSIYGNVQPEVFKVSMKTLSEDGLLQRFIPGVLRTEVTKVGIPIPSFMTSEAKWEQLVRNIFALPEMTYYLNPQAYESYRAFQHWYHDRKLENYMTQSSTAFMTAFGKLEGTVGRLALVFHLIENPFVPYVSQETMDRAINATKNYIIPAYRYAYAEIANTEDKSFSVWMINHIVHYAEFTHTITMKDIRKSARRQLDSEMSPWKRDDKINDAMYYLEECNWAIRVEDNAVGSQATWVLNPRLATDFREYRKSMKSIKQRNFDRVFDGHIKVKGFEEIE